jgi:hypothetical protein
MGAEKPMMERLLKVFTALEDRDEKALDRLRATARPTPARLNPGFTPNQKLLQAAVAYTNALVLEAPGTDPVQAEKLARRVFQVQTTAGHGAIPRNLDDQGIGKGGAVETLTPSHAQLWHAGSAALLTAALLADDASVAVLAGIWWRAQAALCHLTAWSTDWKRKKIRGHFKIVAPGARGGSRGPDSAPAENPARDLDYELLLRGKLDFDRDNLREQYFLGPWLLAGLPPAELERLRDPGFGEPLTGPDGLLGPWREHDVPLLPSPLHVRRSDNRHSAWFETLSALEPQFQAGVDGDEPWFKFWDDAEPPLRNGGLSPFPPPGRPQAPVHKFGTRVV